MNQYGRSGQVKRLLLPKPKNLDAPTEQPMPSAPPAPAIAAPPQGRRKGWVPRTLADFGDGGAFPEIHVAQYPLDMGRKKQQSSQVLALTTDASGKARHDMVAAVGQREGKHIVSARDALKGRCATSPHLTPDTIPCGPSWPPDI